MTRKIRNVMNRIENAPLTDVLGGIWLVTLMLSMLHLPSMIA